MVSPLDVGGWAQSASAWPALRISQELQVGASASVSLPVHPRALSDFSGQAMPRLNRIDALPTPRGCEGCGASQPRGGHSCGEEMLDNLAKSSLVVIIVLVLCLELADDAKKTNM